MLSPYKVGQGPILVVLILERMGIENWINKIILLVNAIKKVKQGEW